MSLPDKAYIQYMPDADSRTYLQSLQSGLEHNGVDGRVVSPDQLHMTILHIGWMSEVRKQLRQINPELDDSVFATAMDTLLLSVAALQPKKLEVTVESLHRFGANGNTLVLLLKRSAEIVDLYSRTMAMLTMFCIDCGIPSVRAIPALPKAIQVSDMIIPHITLLKGTQGNQEASLPAGAIGTRLTLLPY